MIATSWGAYVSPGAVKGRFERAMETGETIRAWAFHGRTVSVRERDSLYKANFLYPDDELLADFLEQLRDQGFLGSKGHDPRPSSYAWPWHERVKTLRASKTLRYAYSARFEHDRQTKPSRPYPWQEAWPSRSLSERRELHGTVVRGPWHLYDMRSAYAWAVSLGLPDTRYTIHVDRITGRFLRRGLYLVRDPQITVACPPPRFRRPKARDHWMSDEEIEQLGVKAPHVLYGLEFPRMVDLLPEVDYFVGHFPETTWKRTFRAFWGTWAGTDGPEEIVVRDRVQKRRQLPAFRSNPVWSDFVLSRVALRISEFASAAAHVYVDSVLVPHSIRQNKGLGGWLLKETHQEARVLGAGNWGDGRRQLRHAGVKMPTEQPVEVGA